MRLNGSQFMIHVHHLFISPGHNYFGHHGGPSGHHPVLERNLVECVAGRGLRGDRFFDYKPDNKGQVALFSQEVFDALCRELSLARVMPSALRRNIIVSGVDLNDLIGAEFQIQRVRFSGSEACRPCCWMNEALGDERGEQWLQGRGGLRCRVLTDGFIASEN